jgi:pilus assembly protein FimV
MMGIVAGLLGLLLGALPFSAHALALGKLKVHSALNEPLNAEIDFASVTEKELKGLKAQLASRADFEQAGVERLQFLSQIKFVVSKRLDGRYFLQLSTDQQIEEPFLHFILQLDWPGGRLLREYTALIDPPYQVAGQPAAIEVPRSEPEVPPVEEQLAAAPVAPPPVAPSEPTAMTEPARLPEVAPPAGGARETAPAPTAPPEPELLGPDDVRKSRVTISPDTGWPVEQPAAVSTVEPLSSSARTGDVGGAAVAPTTIPVWANMADYRVKNGDTAWAIAERVRGDRNISTEQVVLALYRANRGAFFGNNVNNLYAGKILKIPERDEVESLNVAAARKEFRAQYDVWQEYKLKLASASREIKVTPEAATPGQAETHPAKQPTKEQAKDVAPATKGAQPDELLRIVRSNVEAKKDAADKPGAETEATKDSSGKERQALADRVATLEESLVSKEMEQRDMSEKVGQVRELLKKEAKLLEVESKPLADAQPAKSTPDIAPKTEVAKTEPVAPPPAPTTKPEEAKPAAPVKPAPGAKVERAAPAKKRPVTPPPPPPEKGMVAEIMDSFGDLIMPVVIGLLVIVGGAIGFVYMRRRRKSIAEFEESILASEGMTALEGTTTTDTAGVQAAPTGDTSFLSDFSQGGMGTVHTDEVDPIAEAEVYLAYGRDETAEEILKDAIVKNPKREELKVKLLEIYHQRNDVNAFETLAEEYYAQLGGRPGKLWPKVEEMGRKLNPNNPMFRGGAGGKEVAAAAAAATSFASALGDVQPIGARAHVADEPATQPPGTLDFNVGGEPPQTSTAETTAFDFDLGTPAAESESGATSIEFESAKPAEAAPPPEPPSFESMDLGQPADSGIAFDLGGPASEEEPAVAEEPAPETPASSTDTGLNWDFEAGGTAAEAAAPAESAESGGSSWDETATKLDLAKAYIDMGDSEGARSILNEVMSEGNAEQKQQARDLAAQIG